MFTDSPSVGFVRTEKLSVLDVPTDHSKSSSGDREGNFGGLRTRIASLESGSSVISSAAAPSGELCRRSASNINPVLSTETNSERSSAVCSSTLILKNFPVVRFEEKDLLAVRSELEAFDVDLDYWLHPMGVVPRQKKAALLLQELNLSRMLGLSDDYQNILDTNTAVDELFDHIDPNISKDKTSGLARNQWANPLSLWPIDDKCLQYLKRKSRTQEEVISKFLSLIPKSIDLEQATYEIVAMMIEEAYKNRENEYHGKKIDLEIQLGKISPEVYQKITVEYKEKLAFLRENGPKFIYGTDRSELAGIHLSEFERKLLACHQIYHECGGSTATALNKVNTIYIDYLEIYKEQIENLTHARDISHSEIQHLAFLWVDRLTVFNQLTTRIHFAAKFKFSAEGNKIEQLSHRNLGITYQTKCFNMVIWAVENNLHKLLDFSSLRILMLSTLKYLVSVDGVIKNKKLILELSDNLVQSAGNDDQKMMAYNDYVFLCEILGEWALFNEFWEAASQFSAYPLFLRVIFDLGIERISQNRQDGEGRSSVWIERAISGLVKIKENIEGLRSVMGDIEDIISTVDMSADSTQKIGSGSTKKKGLLQNLILRYALYHYLAGDVKKANQFLTSFGYQRGDYLYLYGLSLVAQNSYELAISSLEKSLENNPNYTYIINPILACLHCRVAKRVLMDTPDPDKSTKHFDNARRFLEKIVLTRSEFYQTLADVQVHLEDYSGAIKSLGLYCRYLEQNLSGSVEIDQISVLREQQEHLTELAANQPVNESLKVETDVDSKKIKKSLREKKLKSKGVSHQDHSHRSMLTKSESFEHDEKMIQDFSGSLDLLGLDDKHFKTDEAPSTQTQAESCLSTGNSYCEDDREVLVGSGMHQASLSIEEESDASWKIMENKVKRKKNKEEINFTPWSETEAEQVIRSSRGVRFVLYNALIQNKMVDYEMLLDRHDELLKRAEHPVLRLLMVQNKAWTQRVYTFDSYALSLKAKSTGKSISELKMELRKSSMELLFLEVERVFSLLGIVLPETWKTEPEIIPYHPAFKVFQKRVSNRSSVQLGAQFSTLAHIMADIFNDQPLRSTDKRKAVEFFEKKPDEFNQLAKRYYQCRNLINPEHQSHLYSSVASNA